MGRKHLARTVGVGLIPALSGFAACARERSSTLAAEVQSSNGEKSSVDRAIDAERVSGGTIFRVVPEGISVELQAVVLSVSDVALSTEPKEGWVSATVVIRNEGLSAARVCTPAAVSSSILRSTLFSTAGKPMQNANWVVTRSLGHARFESDFVTIEPGANWSGVVHTRAAVSVTSLLGDATAGLCEIERDGGKQRCPIRIERAKADAVGSST
jgi:hypothetical protein